MPTLAATLKSEIRRIAGREMKKALRPLQRLVRQIKSVRLATREQRRTLMRLERRLARLGRGAGLAQRRSSDSGPRISPAAIRLLRRRMKMTRLQFAKTLAVSPGSIFGWETGRSLPRGGSRAKLVKLEEKLSARRGRRGRARKTS
jgi:hypothetical protein